METLQAFRREQSGNVTITVAICLAMVLSVAAVAIDYSYAALQRTELQRATDAAALAGAKLSSAEVKAVEDEAKLFFQGIDGLRVAPIVSVTAETVTVQASYSQPTFLMHAFGQKHINIGARAVAGRGSPAVPCVLTLDKVEKESLYINSASKLNTDCGVQANSSASEALRTNSGSSINAEQTCVVGGWSPGGSNVYQPAPKKCPIFPDPLVNLPTPPEASAACTKSDYRIDKLSATLSPGVYCNNLTIENGAIVTLNPGIYVIRDGILKINSGATLKGDGVLLFFIGKDARLQMDSLSFLHVSAPTSDSYADIVIYQDRNTYTDFFTINSHGNARITGIIYIPNSTLKLNSDSGVTGAPTYLQIIVHRFELNSLATLVIRNKNYTPKQATLRQKFVTLIQ
jgi:hypothetical protein